MDPGMKDEATARRRSMFSWPWARRISESESPSGTSSTSIYPLSLWRVRRFVPALRRISGELHLPEPTKSRVLLEMAADLEALYEHYRARGLGEEEAARRAEEKVLASPEAVQHLVLVHTTGYQRWLSRASGRLRWGLDLVLFLAGVVPFLIISALVVAAQIEGTKDIPFLWTILPLGAAIVVLTMWKGFQLFIQRERSISRLHRGLFTLLFLGVIGPVVGAIACFVSLHRTAMMLMHMGADEPARLVAVDQVIRSGTLLSFGLLLGFGAGLVWFVLANRIAVIEQAESQRLLAE